MAKRFEQAKAYTERYRSVLLPCRICGNTDVRIVSDRDMFPARNVWGVACMTPKCDCGKCFTSVKAAVQAWNEQAQKPLPSYLK